MLFNRVLNSLLGVLLLLAVAQASHAQDQAAVSSDGKTEVLAAADDDSKGAKQSTTGADTKPQAPECKLCRWFELQTASLS